MVKHLRSLGIRLVLYVDDYLVLAQPCHIIAHRDLVVTLLQSLGWPINWDKSDIRSLSAKVFLGYIVNSENDPYLQVPSDKWQKFKKDINVSLQRMSFRSGF